MNNYRKSASEIHYARAAPHGTNRVTVVAVVVVPIHIGRIEPQVPRVVRVGLVERTRPVVAVRANVVEVSTVAVTGGRKKKSTICVGG